MSMGLVFACHWEEMRCMNIFMLCFSALQVVSRYRRYPMEGIHQVIFKKIQSFSFPFFSPILYLCLSESSNWSLFQADSFRFRGNVKIR